MMYCEDATCGKVETCPVCRMCASSPEAAAVVKRQISQRKRTVALPTVRTTRGVGTHLKLLLMSLGLEESVSCSCASMRAQMDAWGPAGCRRNQHAILTHLRTEAGKVGWTVSLKTGVKAAVSGLILNPIDPAPGLLNEAVRRAEVEIQEYSGPAGRWLSVPTPPRFPTPTRDLAVITYVVGDEAERCHRATGPSQAAFARSIGADYIVSRWNPIPTWGMASKFAAHAALTGGYKRVMSIDADALTPPGCVNPVAMTAPGFFGAYDERPFHQPLRGSNDVEPAFDRFRERMGGPRERPVPYFNCGVWVADAGHAHLLEPPDRLWVETVGYGGNWAEQNLIILRVVATGVPYQCLDRRANWQAWIHDGFDDAPLDAILHYSGGPQRHRRAEILQEIADVRPWPKTSISV